MAYDKTTFLSGLAMGLTGKGNPTFEASDVFSKGYLTGAELRAKRVMPEGGPVAYLYNGVQLPALPEWDKEADLYAVIEYAELDSLASGGRMARLILSSELIVYTTSGLYNGYNLSGDVVCYGWANNEFIWEFSLNMDAPAPPYNKWVKMSEEHFDETTFKGEKVIAADPIWANFDLRMVTTIFDRLLVSATDPIPVYEKE